MRNSSQNPLSIFCLPFLLQNTVDKLVQRANASLLIGTSSWREQFCEALTVSAGDDSGRSDEGDGEEPAPSCMDYCMHFLTLFWKIIFAFIPPTGEFILILFLITCLPALTFNRVISVPRYVWWVPLFRSINLLYRRGNRDYRRCRITFRLHARHPGLGNRYRVRRPRHKYSRWVIVNYLKLLGHLNICRKLSVITGNCGDNLYDSCYYGCTVCLLKFKSYNKVFVIFDIRV